MSNHTTVCPYCGTEIEIEDDIVAFRCPNCTAAIVLEEAVATPQSRLYEQSSSRPEREDNKPNTNIKKRVFTVLLVVVCVAIGAMLAGIFNNHSARTVEVPMPYSLSDFKDMDYMKAKEILGSAGFTNIKLEKEDKQFNVVTGAINGVTNHIETGDIKEIVIDQAKRKFKKGDTFLSDAEIVITYYNVIK